MEIEIFTHPTLSTLVSQVEVTVTADVVPLSILRFDLTRHPADRVVVAHP